MTVYSKSSGGFTVSLTVTTLSQSVADNRSYIRRLLKLTYTGSRTAFNLAGSFTVKAGTTVTGSVSARQWSKGESVVLSDTNATVDHGVTGTLSLAVSASVTSITSVSGTYKPAAINRVSSPWLSSSSVDAGSSVTIYTGRKSTDLTHVITYKFGSASGTISSAATSSASWTPSMSLLSQIPSKTSGTVTITVTTKSGSTTIGSKTVSLTLRAPASVKPTVSSISVVDTVSTVAAVVGRFVEGLSKPKATVSGSGTYGSTIKEAVYSLDGQVLPSGTTAKTLSRSGTLTVSAHVTDSRGRDSASDTTTISVLAYTPPTFEKFEVSRARADGTADLEGTSLLLAMDGRVQSLVNSSERNQLVVTVYTRVRGETAWTTRDSFTHTALRYSTPRVIQGEYSIEESFDVRVTISDRFNSAAAQTTVPTAQILMHWNGAAGVGIGKYHERGMLDVGGDVYAESFNGAQIGSPITVALDCNDLVHTGIFQVSNSTLNMPPGRSTSGYEIRAVALASGSVFQTALSYGTTAGRPYDEEWVRDYRNGAWSAWRLTKSPRTAFAPLVTGSSWLGNGSIAGFYTVAGDRARIEIELTIGSTTSITDLILESPLPLPSGVQHSTGGGRLTGANLQLVTLASGGLLYVRTINVESTTSRISQVSLGSGIASSSFVAGRRIEAAFDLSLG